ncbi:ubiquitin-conjugating enzyme E2-18 kDa [Drosophila ficusphila]|uniref:ubiquitin-conjugating enzyme E2-18 kDa n=1 Tax=Drosophila ficusphila TaxID=30025 RepID=UPI0007E6035E|nr:ubiquitin-conjugating enzyme E2-18 kDa [Drosophila ficusphila]
MAKKEELLMDGPKRMNRELALMLEDKQNLQFRNLWVEPNNIYKWSGLLMPVAEPYNKGAFKMEIDFPMDYPFKPPRIHINTRMYHLNVNERGQVCVPILETEHWIPTTRIDQVLQVLLATINDPQPENAWHMEMAGEYHNDPVRFFRMADAWVQKYSERRPTEEELAKFARKRKKAMSKD